MGENKTKLINREISWLSFNDRVLQEAADPRVPLLERIKFLGIHSSNMDEFFRVRVATLKRMADLDETAKKDIGFKPKKILQQIQDTVLDLRHESDRVYENLLGELAKENIFIINEKALSPSQGEYVRTYFQQVVRPTLVPIMLDSAPAFPMLRDKAIYLAVLLSKKHGKTTHRKHALIELPTDVVPRFLVLPSDAEKNFIILLDDIIRFCLDEIFAIFRFTQYEAYTIKLTRDAELDLDDDVSESLLHKISKSLKQRKRGRPVRFIYDEEMPAELMRFLTRRLKLRKNDNLIPGGRYHNFKDFISFPNIGPPQLHYASRMPLPHPYLAQYPNMFEAIRKRDVLLQFPYQSFDYLIDLLREAAIDPQVVSIKMTLYRVAENSNIVNALINAVKNGKIVTVAVELQARFDEEANIFWANKLREEGAKVIFGVPGLKVHAKLCLITRREKAENIRYAYIGTGNFNEKTARLYSDHGLLTAQKQICNEVYQVFAFLDNNFKIGTYKHLLVSPFFMRQSLNQLIAAEIAHAKAGKQAYMVLKMNSMVDTEMIQRLYEASQAGVRIRMIIRGMCSLKPGVPGMSDNIEAISIVDRYLEHSRILVFGNGGDPKVFIGSADWMTRNLDHRIEVLCPIYDKKTREELLTYLSIQWADNTKARILDKTQSNQYKHFPATPLIRAQEDTYSWLKGYPVRGASVTIFDEPATRPGAEEEHPLLPESNGNGKVKDYKEEEV